jgi:hypothetical protein
MFAPSRIGETVAIADAAFTVTRARAATGDGVGDGDGDAVGEGDGDALAECVGDGVGEGDALPECVGVGVGDALGDGEPGLRPTPAVDPDVAGTALDPPPPPQATMAMLATNARAAARYPRTIVMRSRVRARACTLPASPHGAAMRSRRDHVSHAGAYSVVRIGSHRRKRYLVEARSAPIGSRVGHCTKNPRRYCAGPRRALPG